MCGDQVMTFAHGYSPQRRGPPLARTARVANASSGGLTILGRSAMANPLPTGKRTVGDMRAWLPTSA
jgi:hypothetical protein